MRHLCIAEPSPCVRVHFYIFHFCQNVSGITPQYSRIYNAQPQWKTLIHHRGIFNQFYCSVYCLWFMANILNEIRFNYPSLMECRYSAVLNHKKRELGCTSGWTKSPRSHICILERLLIYTPFHFVWTKCFIAQQIFPPEPKVASCTQPSISRHTVGTTAGKG